MILARISLIVTGLAFAGFGLWFLYSPQTMATIGVQLHHANAFAEIRAFYGGLEIGLAAFFFVAAGRPHWFEPALLAQVLALGGAAAARSIAIIMGGTTEIMLGLAAAEAVGCVVGIVALMQVRREPATVRARA